MEQDGHYYNRPISIKKLTLYYYYDFVIRKKCNRDDGSVFNSATFGWSMQYFKNFTINLGFFFFGQAINLGLKRMNGVDV